MNEDISIIIDLNMHLNKSTLKEVFNFFSKNKIKWLEIDSDNYESLKSLKPEFIPIASRKENIFIRIFTLHLPQILLIYV